MEPGAQTFAQTPHLRQSHHDLQGCLLRNLEPHLNPAQQRTCACKRCLNLQQASNSPSTSGVTIPSRYLQHHGLRACADAGANFNGECRYEIRSSHWPANVSPHLRTPQGPCHGMDPPHVPRSLHSNGMAMGAASAHGFTPVASRFAPPSHNQEKDWKQNGPRMEASSKRSGSYGEPTNQVVLHRWFLIRSSGSPQGVKVSVGGFLTPGTAGTERFKTAVIVQRLEKCRLLSYDGLEVLLAGLIDDCTTVSNGFSLDIVQGFLSGFPYTWNLLLNSELSASNPRHINHQVSGNSDLGRGLDTSQLSFEGSEQEKRTLSPSFVDHTERVDMQLNMKQTITTEVQLEKEAATLKNNDSITQPAVEGGEQLDTVSSRDDKVISSNSTDLVGQELINVRMEEEQQEIAHTDQSAHNVKKRRGRPSKRQPDVGSEEGCTALEQIGAGNVVLNRSNDSTENVEKSDQCGQKPQLTPRITRSMQKTSRLEAPNHVSAGVNTGAHSDSLSNCEEVHTPAEQCGPCVKSRSSTTANTIYQKRMENKRSRRTLSKDNDIENIDGGKSSTNSPCYYIGVKNPVEMGAQRPGSSVNAEASPASKEEGCSNQKQACALDLQKEACTVEAVQACDYGPADKEGNVSTSVQMSKEHASFKSVEKLTKTSQNKLNKRESVLSKSPGQGNKWPKNPAPLPRSRAPVSKRLISAAFGLKTSRSGRFLVPPLAHWCSQALLRDKDGGIIGISEGSKNMNEDGSIKFMPPAEASLRKLQKQICEVATDCTPHRKRLGTKRRQ